MRVAIFVMLALLLAGCGGPQILDVSEEAGSSSAIGAKAADKDGDGEPDVEPFVLNVTILDIDTRDPIVGAGVVFRLFECDWCNHASQEVGLRADGNGNVGITIYQELQIHVVAGGLANWTTESATRISSTLGKERHIELPLYRTTKTASLNDTYPLAVRENPGTVQPPAALDGERSQVWHFHADGAIQAAYMERLQSIDLEIHWTNEPTKHGYLHGIIGPADGEGAYAATEGAGYPEPYSGRIMGAHDHFGLFDAAAFKENDALSDAFRIGARLSTTTLAPDGLPYSVAYQATFEGSESYVVRIV